MTAMTASISTSTNETTTTAATTTTTTERRFWYSERQWLKSTNNFSPMFLLLLKGQMYGLISDFYFFNATTVTVLYCHFTDRKYGLLFCSNAQCLTHHCLRESLWFLLWCKKWTVEHANIHANYPNWTSFQLKA